jgi:hypothetical protein
VTLNNDLHTRFVTALYKGVLHRSPSDEEVNAWTTALDGERVSATDIAETFLGSEERQGLVRDLEQKKRALFVPPGHFYSPVVDTAALRAARPSSPLPLPDTLRGLTIDRKSMLRAWKSMLPHLNSCPFTERADERFRYRFDNPAYSWADAMTYYAMIRRFKPKRVIEIGCGWSSACLLDTIEFELGGKCDVTFIEPYPALLYEISAGKPLKANVVSTPLQSVDLSAFDTLAKNDILFIDSTHVMKTGSDVVYEINELLPRIASGVIVHFHDIFWPFEYPDSWVYDENRSWNEIYALRAFLTQNPEWKVLFFNDYFRTVLHAETAADCPNFYKNTGGAIWLQRV